MGVELIRGMPLFAGLNDAQLETVSGALRRHHFDTEDVIVREGAKGDSLYILAKGSVEITKRLGLVVAIPEGVAKEKMLVRLHAPQFFGELGLLEDTERSATVRACTACEVMEISKGEFDRMAAADPMLGYHIVRNIAAVLSGRLRRTDHDVVKLTVALSLALGNR